MNKPNDNHTTASFSEAGAYGQTSPLRGSFHLIYQEKWLPEFISDACLTILSCTREEFIDLLLSAHTFSDSESISVTLMDYLYTPGSYTYHGLHWYQGKHLPNILGTLTIIAEPYGHRKVYGALFDRSAFYQQAEQLKQLSGELSAIVSHQELTESSESAQRRILDQQGLLKVSQSIFSEIVSVNLSQDSYRLLQKEQHTTLSLPANGSFIQFLHTQLTDIPKEDQERYRRTFFPEGLLEQIHSGAQQIHLIYRRQGLQDDPYWIETIAMREDNPYDDDILLIIVSRHLIQGHPAFSQASPSTNTFCPSRFGDGKRPDQEELLRKVGQIFSLTSKHTNRTFLHYDLVSRQFCSWTMDTPEKTAFSYLFENPYDEDDILTDDHILPESLSNLLQLFDDIHAGEPFGETYIHIRNTNQELSWIHIKFSCIEEKGQTTTALLSFADVTKQHEKDMAYLRQKQAIGNHAKNHLAYLEVDLTLDRVEKHIGSPQWKGRFHVGMAYSTNLTVGFANFTGQNERPAAEYYSPASLLQKFESNCCDFEDVWQIKLADKAVLWVQIRVELLLDSFNQHVKMFAHMMDITLIQEAQLAISRRADYDSMTGLLRRDSGVEQIKYRLSSANERDGILILLDLDDLKGINDTLGHAQGDRAIAGISETLIGHFRKDDVLVRLGGDEFMVFLGGAAKSVSSVALAMSNLLKKLAGISIGEHRERCIHCSAGCAVQLPGEDDFDSLYRRADIALYHVKRNGKNNFSFFEPEMLLADYEFKLNATAPKVKSNLEGEELNQFLDMISAHFQGIVFFDLSKNQYRILESSDTKQVLAQTGDLDRFWEITLQKIQETDRPKIQKILLREPLLSAYQSGKSNIRCNFHYCENAAVYFPVSVEVRFYTNQSGDIYAYALFSKTSSQESEREILRLKKILEVSGRSDFEYICLIDIKTKIYRIYSQDGRNSHGIPESGDFNAVVQFIRDTKIEPANRDSYYQAASLEQIMACLEKTKGYYSYHYHMKDGTRLASFTWYEDTHSELLLTIQKI